MLIFKHPCKCCLTKPVCKKLCEDFKNYGATVHDITFVLWISTVVTALIVIIYGLYSFTKPLYAHGIMTCILLFGYYQGFKTIFEDLKTFKKDFKYLWQRILMSIIAPVLLLSVYLWDRMDFVEKPIENYIYRHIMKMHPDKR